MAKHSTSICQWSWFSIDSLPTSQILALTLESWQNMPWKVQLVSKNSTTTTTATKIHPLNDAPQKTTPAVLPSPNSPSEKVSCVFFGCAAKTDKWSLWRTFPYTKLVFSRTVSWHCAILQFYLRESCPIFIHSSHFHADRKRNTANTVNTYISLYTTSHKMSCLLVPQKNYPKCPQISKATFQPAGLQWRADWWWQKVVHMIFYDRSFNHWKRYLFICGAAVLKFIHSCPVSYQGRLCGNWPQTISRPSIFLWRLVSKSPCVLALVFFPIEWGSFQCETTCVVTWRI